MNETGSDRRYCTKIIIGLVCIVTAILILINDSLFGGEIHIFKLVLILCLAAFTIYSAKRRMYTGVFFPIAFIYILCADDFGIYGVGAATALFIALLLSVGCHLLFGRNHNSIHDFDTCCKDNPYREAAVDDSNYVSVRCSFTGVNKKVTASSLKKVEIYTSFAGIMLDLSQASLGTDRLPINIEAGFSGVELYIPSNWVVENNLRCVLAGVEDKRAGLANGPVVVLEGDLHLAGIKILRV